MLLEAFLYATQRLRIVLKWESPFKYLGLEVEGNPKKVPVMGANSKQIKI